jgi:hypothetical protein
VAGTSVAVEGTTGMQIATMFLHFCLALLQRGGRWGITPAEENTDAREPICPYGIVAFWRGVW